MAHTVDTWPDLALSHCCIQMKQIRQDMDNFVFLILLKQKQNCLKTNQTKGV
jgi:hypothetical protein